MGMGLLVAEIAPHALQHTSRSGTGTSNTEPGRLLAKDSASQSIASCSCLAMSGTTRAPALGKPVPASISLLPMHKSHALSLCSGFNTAEAFCLI